MCTQSIKTANNLYYLLFVTPFSLSISQPVKKKSLQLKGIVKNGPASCNTYTVWPEPI